MGPVLVVRPGFPGDLDHESRPVGIRVGPDHEIEAFQGFRAVLFPVSVHGNLGSHGITRVRLLFRVILKCGEKAVELVQLVPGYPVHAGETEVLQQPRHGLTPGPVEGAIPDP